MNSSQNTVQYLVDENGKKAAVVIPLTGNEAAVKEFLEDVYGHRVISERRGKPTLSAGALVKRLKRDGFARQ